MILLILTLIISWQIWEKIQPKFLEELLLRKAEKTTSTPNPTMNQETEINAGDRASVTIL